MFTKAQVHAMLDDIQDANSSITCGLAIKRIRDDIDADPPVPPVPPEPQAMQPVDTLAQQLILLVSRIGYSDQGDVYEVDAEGWEALQRVVEQNIAPETIALIRLAATMQRDPTNKAIQHANEAATIRGMMAAMSPCNERPRAWRCEPPVDYSTDRNPGYYVWSDGAMWWKTDGRGWFPSSIIKTPSDADNDPYVEEVDATMALELSESRCPTCESGAGYMGHYCIGCGRDTRS